MKIESGSSYYFANRNAGENGKDNRQDTGSFADSIGKQSASVTAYEPKVYDFTDITSGELLEAVNSLIRDGQMDLDESSSLLGFMGNSPLSVVEGNGVAHAAANGSFNVFARIQEGIEGALSRSEIGSAEGLRLAASALQRFQGQLAENGLKA